MFPLWYISFFEISVEVRQRSSENFAFAFKTNEKKANVFLLTYENFFSFVQEQFLHNETSLTEDITEFDKVQRESIFDRIISSCLDALAHCSIYTTQWP